MLPHSPAPHLPYRQLSRLVTELHLSGVQLIRDAFPDGYHTGVLFLLMTRICLEDWTVDGVVRPPEIIRRSVTVNAVAASLACSFETTRRHARAMVEAGILARHDNRLALATTPDSAGRVVAYYAAIHDIFLRYIEDLHASCDIDLGFTASKPVDQGAILARALDVNIMPFDVEHATHGNWITQMLFLAITTANTRHVTYDRRLSRLYAYDATPDDLRRPVSLRSAAKLLRISYATAWRHCAVLEDAGLITRKPSGWVVLRSNLNTDTLAPVVKTNADYVVRKVRELALLGLDPGTVAGRYIVGRPPLVDD